MLKKSLTLLQFGLLLSASYAIPDSVQFLLSFAVIASVFPWRASATSTSTLTILEGNSTYSLAVIGPLLESDGIQYITGTNYRGTNTQQFRNGVLIRLNNDSQSIISQAYTLGTLTSFQSQFLSNDTLYAYGSTTYNNQLTPYFSKNDKYNLTHLNSWTIQGVTGTALKIENSPAQNHICFCTSGRVFEINFDTENILSAYSIRVAGNSAISSTMIRLQDGDYLFSGSAQSKGWVTRLKYNNSAWSEVWSRNLAASSAINILDTLEDHDRIYLTGTLGTDAYIAAINASSGENLWAPRSIGGAGTDVLRGIQKKTDTSNDLIAYGYTSTGMSGSNFAYWLLSLDANANIQKNMNLNGTGSSVLSYVASHSSGAITLSGYSNAYGGSLNKPLLVTTDNNGDIDKTILHPYGFSYNDMSSQMTLDAIAITNSPTTVSFMPISGASFVRVNVTISDPKIKKLLDVTATPYPTSQPTGQPSNAPSGQPTRRPTGQPSNAPSGQPTRRPTGQPSNAPSGQPTRRPTGQPSKAPSGQPTRRPTGQPSNVPSGQPTRRPTGQPSNAPSEQPTRHPTGQPSNAPSGQPTRRPTGQPSNAPSGQPTRRPLVLSPAPEIV